jgi:hypothetical protein
MRDRPMKKGQARWVRYPAPDAIGIGLRTGATHTHRNTPIGGTQCLALSPEHHAL